MKHLIDILIIIAIAFSVFTNVSRKRQEGVGDGPVKSAMPSLSLSSVLGFFSLLKKPDADILARRALADAQQADIIAALKKDIPPKAMRDRLQASRDGTSPWIATLSPAELLITSSHGIRPVAAVSATCWLHYGYSWTDGHSQGWETAFKRLREEAKAAGANAVVDVKMRTISLPIASSMDFTLVGTAVKVDGLPPSSDPVIATVPALEFVKLLEAGIIPTGIAIGAEYQWMDDWRGAANLFWAGNTECTALSSLWERVRHRAHANLRASAQKQGGGVLAHINFSQMFERVVDKQPKQYLARHIVIATTIDVPATAAATGVPHEFRMVVDMHAGKTPLTGTTQHHQSYENNEEQGAI